MEFSDDIVTSCWSKGRFPVELIGSCSDIANSLTEIGGICSDIVKNCSEFAESSCSRLLFICVDLDLKQETSELLTMDGSEFVGSSK